MASSFTVLILVVYMPQCNMSRTLFINKFNSAYVTIIDILSLFTI